MLMNCESMRAGHFLLLRNSSYNFYVRETMNSYLGVHLHLGILKGAWAEMLWRNCAEQNELALWLENLPQHSGERSDTFTAGTCLLFFTRETMKSILVFIWRF